MTFLIHVYFTNYKPFFNCLILIFVLILLLLQHSNNNVACFILTAANSNENSNIIRLNKLIAIEKKISRRKSDKFIEDGNVKINNVIIKNPGTHVNITNCKLKINNKLVHINKLVQNISKKVNKWIVLHKPKGYICTTSDEKNRLSIFSLFPDELLKSYRIVSVGRLDRNTSGVLLLTDEYSWVNKLTHPKYQRIRTYRIHIEGSVQMKALKEIANGVYLKNENDKKNIIKNNRKTQPALIEIIREETVKIKDQTKTISILNITIKEGRNRQIKKMFEQINQPVIKIKRTAFENITLKNIHFPKQYRELTQKEIGSLKTRNF
ncbi:pseudouridine synthase, putative [Hepatocystis sp. ex Piliocolobus tephrosceles]|nr:pseudouridine synthase, putative [Hepatocystis sp. ex Piliocolobus tephrosceles]